MFLTDTDTKAKSHHGKNLKRIRTLKGIDLSSLAKKMNMSEQDLSSIEEKEHIEKELLIQLAKALGVPTEVLETFFNDNPMCHFENFNNNDQAVNNFMYYNNNNNYYYNHMDSVKELYERIIKTKEELIKLEKEKYLALEELLKKK